MRAAGIHTLGGAVEILDLPDPRPLAEDEVLIELRAAGVGNWDAFVRSGAWDVGRRPPMALGVEAAGVVAAIGDPAEAWEPGDEVLTHPLPLQGQGTWAPWLIAPAAGLARKPADISWEAAAAFPVPALTAAKVIDETLHADVDDIVVVHGAGGVTGTLLVALAAWRGAEVIATSSPANHARVARVGAAHVLDYHDAGWIEEARAIGGGSGVSAAANAARGAAVDAIRTVRDRGRLATITGDAPTAKRGIRVSTVYVQPDGPMLRDLAQLLAAGILDILSPRPSACPTRHRRSPLQRAGVPEEPSCFACDKPRSAAVSSFALGLPQRMPTIVRRSRSGEIAGATGRHYA